MGSAASSFGRGGPRPASGQRAPLSVDLALTCVAVLSLAWVAINTTHAARVSAVWPANAIVAARLIATPSRRWAAYVLAGFAGNFAACLLAGDLLVAAVILAFANTIEILLCCAGVRLLLGPGLDFSRLKHLAIFAALAVVSSVVSAGLAIAGLRIDGFHPHSTSVALWAVADALGLMIVAPSLLALDRASLDRFLAPGQRGRNLALLACLLSAAAVVGPLSHHQLWYLIFAVLMVIAFTGESAGAALGLLIVLGMFIAGSELGVGAPGSSRRSPESEALFAQLFLLASAVLAFAIAGVMQRRRELEETLVATVRDYQTLADHSADMIVRIDRDRRILYVSPSCRRLGYRPADLVGATIDRLVHPEAVEPLRHGLDAILSGKHAPTGAPYEMRIRTRDGDWIWAEGISQVVPGPDGAPEGVVTQLRDITQRRAAQRALAESENRYRLLADLATDIIVTMDAKGVIRYISPACRRLGFSPEEMVGVPAIDFVHPDEAPLALSRAELLLTGKRQQGEGMEYRARTKDGGWVWLEGASTIAKDEAGELIMVSHLRDVTERRAFEDELRRKHAEAEAATLAKSEFLANMSHEIRTPLTGIMGFAGLMESVEGLPTAARSYASRIATASRTLLTVVNDILDFSKIEAGQVELDPEPFDPAAFMAETLELVAMQARQKQLALLLETDGALPPAVAADSSRLRQVLLNLLSNAVKFTDAGAITVRVAFEADAGGRLRISVADTGVGIAPDRLGRLFQRFSQADGSINRQYGGTGLGLAICKSLTELMGGEIGVESAEGHGSRFWFTIPAPTCEPAPEAAHEPESEFDARPARILIVDDTPVNRELVSTLLGVFGHDLREASGGAEAVEAAAHATFDLILMDLQMPGMDGIAATRAIRATSLVNRTTPIVALSANILPAHVEACRAAGMDDHIGKPIDTRELLTKVARWTAPDARGEWARKVG